VKKIIAVLLVLILIAVIVITVNIKNEQKRKLEIEAFNLPFVEYDKDTVNGLEVITAINKAINNNEKYNIEKDEKGKYVDDGQVSIRVFVKIGDNTYNMERINELGRESFIEYFGTNSFTCEEIKYHEETGRVSELVFKAN
jgi:hypothetical protein